MKVEITRNDIDGGGMTPEDCPAALALNRRFGLSGRKDSSFSSVTGRGIMLVNACIGGHRIRHLSVPSELARFIHAYDKGDPVDPINFLVIEREWKVP